MKSIGHIDRYAEIAGMPAETGLYAAIGAILGYFGYFA